MAKSGESFENWGWEKLTSTAGRVFTIAASSYFHYSPFFELFSINIYPCSSRNFKSKEAPPSLSKWFPICWSCVTGWMIGNRLLSPCLLQNPATSFQPPYRFSLRHAFAWNSKRQYQILTRSWSSLDSSYTVRSIGRNIEQTLARKSRYRPHISANLFHDPRVFDFTSSFPFRRTATGESTIEGDRRGLIDR